MKTSAVTLSAVAIENVTKRYGRHRALAGVSARLLPGRLCALLGPNGAGKSTLVGLISALIRPTKGQVLFEQNDRRVAPRDVRGTIGLLGHESAVYGELSAVENLRLFGALYDVPDAHARAQELLAQVGLEKAAHTRPARTYSRGMLQRLSLARALLHEPRLLLLDEPFSGLDRKGAEQVAGLFQKIKAAGRILLVVTHDLESIGGLCDHVLVLKRGQLMHEQVREQAFSHAELRELYFQHTE